MSSASSSSGIVRFLAKPGEIRRLSFLHPVYPESPPGKRIKEIFQV